MKQWHHLSPREDGIEGIGTIEAYRKFKLPTNRSPSPVLVAVIDSGVDINHEDFKDADGKAVAIWDNPGEVKDGKDNDGDGKIDNDHGWNYLGNIVDGKLVFPRDRSLEIPREVLRLRALEKTGPLPKEMQPYYDAIMKVFAQDPDGEASLKQAEEGLRNRKEVIGDDVMDITDRNYGNWEVTGGASGLHGTHVAGIIGAVRDNAKGTMGVASDVTIMSQRILDSSDEHDKDVALAIRDAVDAGAQIINMSFGKQGSPLRGAVEDALCYAAAKDVLIIHAAGNDGIDLSADGGLRVPSKFVERAPAAQIPGFIDVGASSSRADENLAARFSNWGPTVDVFAPGVAILAPTPKNTYKELNGTSMASPVTAGLCAVLRSQYPELTAVDIKSIVMETVRTYPDLIVNQPKSQGKVKVPFADLSLTGGIVDLVNALNRAEEIFKEQEA